jgi:pyruvate/2-oxoglutarate dehydrogenase complex dihydrolipoamide acyltransferase (E2) component
MRTNVPHIFAIGDIVGQPMLAHKAVHEAHVAAEVAAGHKAAFDATVIPGVAYTHPEVAWVGYTEDQAKQEGRKVETAKFPWAASGRAIANGADYGFTKLIFDAETHRVIGGTIVGPNAGDMIGEVCLAIEMGCDAVDIGKTIHPHPTLGETVGMAAEVAHGSARTCRRRARSKSSRQRSTALPAWPSPSASPKNSTMKAPSRSSIGSIASAPSTCAPIICIRAWASVSRPPAASSGWADVSPRSR